MVLEDRCVKTQPQAGTHRLGKGCLISSAGSGWVPSAGKERAAAGKASAWGAGHVPADRLPVGLRRPASSAGTRSPARVLPSPQSPPKLNEVSSDAARENAAAESGSESSSQEATPEKGMSRCHHLLGRVPSHRGTAHPHPCSGGTRAPARGRVGSHARSPRRGGIGKP